MAKPLIKSLGLLVLLGLFLGGCVEKELAADPPVSDAPTKVFVANYDEVWRSVQLALRKYPVHLNNIESGLLETDYIKGDKLFAEPVEDKTKFGMRYKLTIRAVKGKFNDKSAIKIICTKVSEIQRDFFTGYQPIPSNGLEENLVLYRIGRYLEMDHMLSKISAGQN
jgi:hypothetical protein